MKMQKKYNERLIKFAKHLEKITNHHEMGLIDTAELIELEENKYTGYKMVYHGWVFDELPLVFDEWYFHHDFGHPLYEGGPIEYGTTGCVADFFGLSRTELMHLFDLQRSQDTDKYGGLILDFDSEGPELCINIFDLVEFRTKNDN
jgi:hypothetical protein